VGGPCTASAIITQFAVSVPCICARLRLIGTESPLWVEVTTSNSAAATEVVAMREKPEPAPNTLLISSPARPSIMSLAFEVDEIVALIG